MLKIIKATDTIKDNEKLLQLPKKCYNCNCDDIDKLYLISNNNNKNNILNRCYCIDCLPIDILTNGVDTYQTDEEFKNSIAWMAYLLRGEKFSRSYISQQLLGFDLTKI